ncbi:helix-turn-helix domain-containing protein [Rhodococcus hoagii]|nr:helix-turn-helix domain-containing protein [Prescottella equi]
MADTDRRSGAELRARRELLGLNAQETAALLGVDERVIRRWEQASPSPKASSPNSRNSNRSRTT